MTGPPFKILLIEDNAGDARLIQEMLAEANGALFEISFASRLAAGLEHLVASGVDLILLDLSLPDSRGLDSFLKVKARAPQIPIIVLSGLNDKDLAIEAVRHGAQDYLVKGGVDGELLTHAIRYAIERKQVEEMLRQRTADLEARNEELDAFAHTVAHDLKAPLGLIVGYASVLLEAYPTLPEDEIRSYLNAVANNALKMAEIIDALLLLAGVRKMKVKIGPLNMKDILPEALERLTRLIDEYQAEINSPEQWPEALGYGPWVEQVWVNYLTNAVKYGGVPPRVELGATVQADGMVCFWVRDNGPGIAPPDQASLFAPFTRLGPGESIGYGLGLSIVRGIVEKLGGQVGVISELGKGSTFTFTLQSA
jgi:signal transduction histidine kinase